MEIPVEHRLREHNLRPTRQRIALAELIFAKGHRHITAEKLYEEAIEANAPVSLATIYNTLHQFTQAGLLRIIAVEGSRTWFDTNISDHHHFYLEHESCVVDMPDNPAGRPVVDNLPSPPEGMEITNVDLIVRVRPQSGQRKKLY